MDSNACTILILKKPQIELLNNEIKLAGLIDLIETMIIMVYLK